MGKSNVFLGIFNRRSPKPVFSTHADIVSINRIIKRTPRPEDKKELTSVLLTEIIEVDFRFSEASIWEAYAGKRSKRHQQLRTNETVLFLSKTRQQAVFVVGETKINKSIVLDTRRWRIIGSETWTDDNLVYYASQVGLDLMVPSKKTIKEILAAA